MAAGEGREAKLGAITWKATNILPSDLKKVLIGCAGACFDLKILDAETGESLRVGGKIGPRFQPEH